MEKEAQAQELTLLVSEPSLARSVVSYFYYNNKLVGTAAIVIQILLAYFGIIIILNYFMDISPIPHIFFYIYFMISSLSSKGFHSRNTLEVAKF